jgi:hypothetical protein
MNLTELDHKKTKELQSKQSSNELVKNFCPAAQAEMKQSLTRYSIEQNLAKT